MVEAVILSCFFLLTLLPSISTTGSVKEDSDGQSNMSPTLSSVCPTRTMAWTARTEDIKVKLQGSNLSDFSKLTGEVHFVGKSKFTMCLDLTEIDGELFCRLDVKSIMNKETTETEDLEIYLFYDDERHPTDLKLTIVPEPVVISLTPNGSTINGGDSVSVFGTNIQYLNGVYMEITIKGEEFVGDECTIHKDTNSMTCFTPKCSTPCPLKHDSEVVSVSFRGLVGNDLWPRSANNRDLLYHPVPQLFQFRKQEVDYENPVVIISGDKLYTDYRINIKVGDNFTCDREIEKDLLVHITGTTVIKCRIQEHISPDLLGQTFNVSVRVGGEETTYGDIVFVKREKGNKREEKDNRVIVIGIVFSAILLMIAVIIILFIFKKWRKRKKREQEYMTPITNYGFVTSVTDDSEWMERGVMWMRFMEGNGALRKLISSRKLIDNKFLTLGDKIGSGHFGEVFRGILEENQEENQEESGSQETKEIKPISVAVKCLLRELWTRSDYEMFVEEALVMREFNHPNVINLIGVSFQSNGLPQVVTPFMPNGDLLTYLRNQSSTHARVIDLLVFGIEIASGMQYLSSKNIIHRDLAARNCFLDDSFHVKIGDFGLARNTYDKGYYRWQGERMLPIKWMAIECLQGKTTFTTESDVWSYGVCLWEIMSRGIEPYEGIDVRLLGHFLAQGRRLERPESCSREVYEIMLKCWSPEPNERTAFEEILTGIHDHMSSVERRSWERKYPRVRSYVNFPAVDKDVRTEEEVPVSYVVPYSE